MQIALLTLVVVRTASPALAHPGGLAADGCHYCRTNCETYGLETDTRHCHEDTAAPKNVPGPVYVIPSPAAVPGRRAGRLLRGWPATLR